jgi:hypothetical protein
MLAQCISCSIDEAKFMDMLNLTFINILKLVKCLVITMWDFGLIGGKQHHELFFSTRGVTSKRLDITLEWKVPYFGNNCRPLYSHDSCHKWKWDCKCTLCYDLNSPWHCYVVNCKIEFVKWPTTMHWTTMKQFFPYLQGTFDYCIVFHLNS